jgi:2-polyprenyl-6-methoxyphenol hydroxylase-like FAD-dependent oxidoreductase
MTKQAVIVGAGITGMTPARAFSSNGIENLVLGKQESDADGGLAINLPGNAVPLYPGWVSPKTLRFAAALFAVANTAPRRGVCCSRRTRGLSRA